MLLVSGGFVATASFAAYVTWLRGRLLSRE
jgi:hypothetical protein